MSDQPAGAALSEGKGQLLLKKQFPNPGFKVVSLHGLLRHYGLWLLAVERVPDPDKLMRADVGGRFRADKILIRQGFGSLAGFEAGSDLARGYFRDT